MKSLTVKVAKTGRMHLPAEVRRALGLEGPSRVVLTIGRRGPAAHPGGADRVEPYVPGGAASAVNLGEVVANACLALAGALRLRAITADRAWLGVADAVGVRVEVIR